jgi:hypothetical protein
MRDRGDERGHDECDEDARGVCRDERVRDPTVPDEYRRAWVLRLGDQDDVILGRCVEGWTTDPAGARCHLKDLLNRQ